MWSITYAKHSLNRIFFFILSQSPKGQWLEEWVLVLIIRKQNEDVIEKNVLKWTFKYLIVSRFTQFTVLLQASLPSIYILQNFMRIKVDSYIKLVLNTYI